MSQQQLFCVADDRHRAVVLTGCLADLGNPVDRVDHPEIPAFHPALVLWTRRAAQAPWLGELFERFPETIALVIDDVPLPSACKRAVRLQNWPARSADASVGALVRWLRSPDSAASPFSAAKTQSRKPERANKNANQDAGKSANKAAYVVISVCLLLVMTLVITESGSQPEPGGDESFSQLDPMVENTVSDLTSLSTALPVTGQTAAGSGLAASGVAADGSPVPVVLPVVPGPQALPAEFLAASGKSTAGSDSLSHLCRARTPEAARAWFRVLAPELKQVVLQIDCVRAMLARPGFAVLEAEFQA